MTPKINENLFIFLDDERIPSRVTWVPLPEISEWAIARSFGEFVGLVKDEGIPIFITFDHDLADEHYVDGIMASTGEVDKLPYSKYKEGTGLDCAKWLITQLAPHSIPFPSYEVHSMNPVGKQNIISLIESYNRSLLEYDH